MLIVMKADATAGQVEAVVRVIEDLGYRAHPMPGASRTAIGITGNPGAVDPSHFENLPGVSEAVRVSKPYKLVSLDLRSEKTVVQVGDATIGGEELAIIAGPCAIESREQAFVVAEAVRRSGAKFFRGGAFKPRTSPYAFQGLGEEGLALLAKAKKETGLGIVTEIMESSEVELVAQYADLLQVGARNMQNTKLLRALSKIRKPILLKRNFSATLTEFLMSAEYLLAGGNDQVILCERGIRTFVEYTRNTLDLNIVPAIKLLSHLPIIVDPSHGTGRQDLVLPMSRAAIAAGADGLMVEVHPNPAEAFSDGDQSLTPSQFNEMMTELNGIAGVMGRPLTNA